MAQLIAVAVRDSAAGAFNRPFFVPAVGMALRSFEDEVRRVGTPEAPNPMNAHPSDFELYQVGFYEEHTGALVSIPDVVLLQRAKDVLALQS